MTRYARWVRDHGGWIAAPHPVRPTPDYNSLNYRICRRAVAFALGQTLRQVVDAENAIRSKQAYTAEDFTS